MRLFGQGEVIDRREVLDGAVWEVMPVRVVHDDGDVLAVYLAEGTPLIFPSHPRPHPWSGRERWTSTSVLQLHRPGDAHSAWGFFRSGVFTGWYVNFQAPVRRWDSGFDTHDHGVDIWIPAGGGPWQWKDRDDVAQMVGEGRLTAAEADDVWAEADRVARALDRGERWWREWDDWIPDPAWSAPSADASLSRLPGGTRG